MTSRREPLLWCAALPFFRWECVCVCVQTGRRGSRGLYVTCWSTFFFSPSLLRGGHDSQRRDWSPHTWYSPWYPRLLHIAADILWNMLFYVKIKWLFLMFMDRALSFIMQWFVLLHQGFEVWWSHRQRGESSLSKIIAEKHLIEFKKHAKYHVWLCEQQLPRITWYVKLNQVILITLFDIYLRHECQTNWS